MWTGSLLEWMAELLALVESTGTWPTELTRAETVLLPKGGTADPLDRRPITLLPMLYRIWAALRATQFRDWMRSAGIPSLVAGNRGTMASAEHQGLLLGLELEEARAFEDSLAGVAVDWSKCYDHLALHYVEDNLMAAGVPAWFSGPLLSMYRAPRHIKVDGAIGVPRTPLRCIPPGCPAAVDILAMLTLPWVKQARCTHAPSEARAWVDDLTWWGRGDPEAVCPAVSRVQDLVATLRDEYDLVANMTKSCVLGQNQAMIDLLRGRDTALGLPVAHAFKDLGVAQGRGSESRIIMRKRWHVATQRMARIAKL